jgi:hypothetical protein
MNIFAKSGYKPLTRITNLGWQKAQAKSPLSPLTFSPKEQPQNERVLPHLVKELAENSAPSSYIWALRKRPKYPYTMSYNSSPHKGTLVNT